MSCCCSIDESRQARLKRWRTGTKITQHHHHHLGLTNNIGSVFFSLVAALTRFARSLMERAPTTAWWASTGAFPPSGPVTAASSSASHLETWTGKYSRFCVSCRVWDACGTRRLLQLQQQHYWRMLEISMRGEHIMSPTTYKSGNHACGQYAHESETFLSTIVVVNLHGST